MTTIFLLRHADAGDRIAWTGPDKERPLSDKGRKQAKRMAKRLAEYDIVSIQSSPAQRCVQTAQPVADACDVELTVVDAMYEGHALQLPTDDGAHVLCAHGDNIPWTLDRLEIEWGKCAKGSVWKLDIDDKGRLKKAEYWPPE